MRVRVRVEFSTAERRRWCALFGHRWRDTGWTTSSRALGDRPRVQCPVCRRAGAVAPGGHVLMHRNLRESIDDVWPRSVPVLFRWRWTAVRVEDLPGQGDGPPEGT